MLRVCAASVLIAGAFGAIESEFVPTLPLFGTPPSPMWSGFLDASAAENGTMLHYWYAQMEGTEASPSGEGHPVVLWLNGGPGSSSILGMLQEMGPVLMNSTGGLMENPYAWTKQANLLILESPGGVGYSYCAAMANGGSCHNSDISTAAAARAALQDFFVSKFPELSASSFYIAGESYAGV
jgi:serine carboxypeptidase-like clade I